MKPKMHKQEELHQKNRLGTVSRQITVGMSGDGGLHQLYSRETLNSNATPNYNMCLSA